MVLPSVVDSICGFPAGRFSVLRKKFRKDKSRSEWALMDSDGKKVLRWFGEERPSEDRVREEEKRVQFFKHQGCSVQASVRPLGRGKLPTKSEYMMAFELEVPDGVYSVRGPRGETPYPIPDGDYSADDLWEVLRKIVSSPSGAYVAGAVLQTLGFDWS
jgi:hypothetical protein